MSETTERALTALAAEPETAAAIEAARAACTALRWHQALRRRTSEAQAESTVRAARASAALEGARFPIPFVREVIQGRKAPEDLAGVQLMASLRVAVLTSELAASPSQLVTAPLQALSRLHVAAATGLLPAEQIGRPRLGGELPQDLAGLPPAPGSADLAGRLRSLVELLTGSTGAPVVVTAAVAQGEILAMRPFVLGNGLIARAVFRALLISGGVDPTGVIVPEAAFLADAVGYGQAAAGFALGRDVPGWIRHCAQAIVDGAGEGGTVADAVLAGRLPV